MGLLNRKTDNIESSTEAIVRIDDFGNGCGIHARPSATLTRLARTFSCDIALNNLHFDSEETYDAKDMMHWGLLMASTGSRIKISAKGADASLALEALKAALETGTPEELYYISDKYLRIKLGISRRTPTEHSGEANKPSLAELSLAWRDYCETVEIMKKLEETEEKLRKP